MIVYFLCETTMFNYLKKNNYEYFNNLLLFKQLNLFCDFNDINTRICNPFTNSYQWFYNCGYEMKYLGPMNWK